MRQTSKLGEPVYGGAIDIWAIGITLLELLGGMLFAPQAHLSRRPASSLLANIDGLAGPLSEDAWPGLHSLPGWVTGQSVLNEARKGKDKCPDPFAHARRAMCPSGRDLASKLLPLVSQRRMEAHIAVEHDFCSKGRVRELAGSAVAAVDSRGGLGPAGLISGNAPSLTSAASGGALEPAGLVPGDAAASGAGQIITRANEVSSKLTR